jgi:prepilin-type N-terminal cleavage/methylation domain-containing protein
MMGITPQHGFTLVEIAIVLVVIGLLLGAVLKGQEMVTNAKLKRMESDNAGLAAAVFSYQDRYLQLPGDDNDASARFTVYAPGGVEDANVNGGGDGVIGQGNDWAANNGATIVAASAETEKFFGHLRAAGLIPGGSGYDTTRPTNAYGGQIGIQNGALGIAGHVIIFGQIEGPIVRILEAKLDDGLPASGRVQSNVVSADMNVGTDNSALTGYADGSRYNIAFRL